VLLKGEKNMKSISELKQEAKQALKLDYKNNIFIYLVPFVVSIIGVGIQYVPLLSTGLLNHGSSSESAAVVAMLAGMSGASILSLLLSLVASYFQSVVNLTYLEEVRGEKTSVSPVQDLVRFLKSPWIGTIIVNVLFMLVFIFLWSIPTFVISIAGGVVLGMSAGSSSMPVLVTVYVILVILSALLTVWKSLRYQFTIQTAYDEVKRTNAGVYSTYGIKKSNELMRGHVGKMILLSLSFIGWILLILITFGIAAIWVAPYIQTTMMAFYKDLTEDEHGRETLVDHTLDF
jgi:uncharacterized membrane protein